VVIDALDAQRLGRFWEAVVGGERLTDVPEGFETRLSIDGGPVLDLCFQRVPEEPTERPRLHLDVHAGELKALRLESADPARDRPADIGQGEVPWVVLADPEGNAFCVMEERAAYADPCPLAALPLQVADPGPACDFWSWLSGWVPVEGSGVPSLRHPSGRGPLLELCPEVRPKGPAKNRGEPAVPVLEPDPDEVARAIADHGGRELDLGYGELPWRHYADPSGNELCVLRAHP